MLHSKGTIHMTHSIQDTPEIRKASCIMNIFQLQLFFFFFRSLTMGKRGDHIIGYFWGNFAEEASFKH